MHEKLIHGCYCYCNFDWQAIVICC